MGLASVWGSTERNPRINMKLRASSFNSISVNAECYKPHLLPAQGMS